MDAKLCPCEFLIPVAFNDGTPIPAATMIQILQSLDRQFGGYTRLGPRQGSWHGQEELMIAFEVSVPEKEIPRVRRVVRIIGRDLKQEKMYFKVGSPNVELLDPSDGSEGLFT